MLEQYFEHNAYPGLPDRLVLARKSKMTPRQIEVWVCIIYTCRCNFSEAINSFKTTATGQRKKGLL
jgi:hypothetical protein